MVATKRPHICTSIYSLLGVRYIEIDINSYCIRFNDIIIFSGGDDTQGGFIKFEQLGREECMVFSPFLSISDNFPHSVLGLGHSGSRPFIIQTHI